MKDTGPLPPSAMTVREDVRRCLQALPSDLRIPVVLHYYESLTHREVAEGREDGPADAAAIHNEVHRWLATLLLCCQACHVEHTVLNALSAQSYQLRTDVCHTSRPRAFSLIVLLALLLQCRDRSLTM